MASRVGIKDVARAAGVSVGTVSNVVNNPDKVSEAVRLRVRTAIDELGYVRSESARQLRAGRSRMVGMLVLDLGNPFFAEVAKGAERTLRQADFGVMVCNSAGSSAEESEYLAMFAEQRIGGALLTPTEAGGRAARTLRDHGIPFVVVDRALAPHQGCSVSVDDVLGGALATRHLLADGHRSVAFVSGPAHFPQGRDRLRGAATAIEEAGLPASVLQHVKCGQFDVASGRDAGARLLGLSPRPTAVFCANDLLALGVLQALFAAGVQIPQDIALIGYDDIEFAAAAAVPLSSVRQPTAHMGRVAADLLLDEIESAGAHESHAHRRIVLQPELVVRGSSRGIVR